MSETIEGTAIAVRDEPTRSVAIPMPTVSPDEAREAMRKYLELCEAVLGPEDYQEFEQWDNNLKHRVKKRFKKKSAVKKLQTFFSVSVVVKERTLHELPDGHFAWSITSTATTPGGRPVEATGACSTMEERFEIERKESWSDADFAYRVKKANARAFHDVLSTAETRSTNRAVMNCIGVGGGEVTADEISRPSQRRPEPQPASPPRKPPTTPDAPPAAPSPTDALIERAVAVGAIGPEDGKAQLRAWCRARSVEWKVDAIREALEAFEAVEAQSPPAAPSAPPTQAQATNRGGPEGQRRLAMKLAADLGLDDEARHAFYREATIGTYAADGSELGSWAQVVEAGKASVVLDALTREVARRAEIQALDEALPTPGEQRVLL